MSDLSPKECKQFAQSIPATRSRLPWSFYGKSRTPGPQRFETPRSPCTICQSVELRRPSAEIQVCRKFRLFSLPGQGTSWLNPGPPASLTFKTNSQGCDHVAVAGWQGSQSRRRVSLRAPSPGAYPPLPDRRSLLPRVRVPSGGTGHGIAGVCPAGVRGLTQMRPSGARFPAGTQR